jgi:AcrR family transcriptional regulator
VPEAGLRERQKRAVRTSLERAALELFLERGFGGTSVDDIAARAAVSRSTFFRYFGSKEAVIFGPFDVIGESLARAILARPTNEPPLQAFEEGLVVNSTSIRADGEQHDEQIARYRDRVVQRDPELQTRAREFTLRWQSRVASTLAQRDGMDVPRAAHLLAAAVGIAVTERIADEWRRHPHMDVEKLIRDQFELLRTLIT